MIFEVVNQHGLTILKTDNLNDMFKPNELQDLSSYGYTFRLNGEPVSEAEAYNATVAAYFTEAAKR